jgi:Carbohydrate binding domain
MFKRAPLLALFGLLVFVSIFSTVLLPPKHTVSAATTNTLNFQARLLSSTGALVPDGNYNVELKLYDAVTSSGSSQGSCTGDSNCLWTETRTSTNQVRVVNGYLTVNLGSVTSFPTTIKWDQQLWLGMNIGGTSGSPVWDNEMTPRLQLTAVPYAFRAGMLAAQNGSNLATLDFNAPTAPRTIHLPDENGTLCIQSSTACGFASSSGAGSYIQNGTSPQAADFNITGTGKAAVFDSTGTTLSIGPSASSGITLQQNTTLANGKSLTLQGNVTQTNGAVSLTANAASSFTTTSGALTLEGAGGVAINALSTNSITLTTNSSSSGVIVKSATNSNNGFQIQNAGGVQLLGADTVGASVIVPSASFVTAYGGFGSFQNLLTYSEQFDNAIWVKNNLSAAANNATAPNGTATAETVTTTNVSHTIYQVATVTASTTYTFSWWAKAGTQSAVKYSIFDVTHSADIVSATSYNVGAGWQRYSTTFTTPSGTTSIRVYPLRDSGATGTVLLWGAQLEQASTVGTYIRTEGTNVATSKLGLAINGSAVFKNNIDSTTAFQIQNAAGNSTVFNADTTNGRVGIGNAAPSTDLDIGPASLAPSQIVQLRVGDFLIQSQQGAANGLTTLTSRGSNGNMTLDAAAGSSIYFSPFTTNDNYLAAGGGKVRIGDQTAPTYKLDVAGDINTSTTLKVTGTTVCDAVGSIGCVAKSGSGFYIHNQTTTQSANLNVQAATSGTVAATFQANGSGSADVLDLLNGSGTSIATFGSTGNVLLQASANANNVMQVENSLGYQAFNIDTTTNNLITNSSFEQATTTGWSQKGSPLPTLGTTTTQHLDGSNAMTIGTNTSNTNGAKYNFTLVSGTTYTFAVSVRASVAFTGIEIGYSVNGSTDTACVLSDNTVSATLWKRYICTFTPASSSGTTYVYLRQTDAVSKTLYVDAAQLEVSGAATPYRYADKTAIGGSLMVNGNQAQAAASTWALQVNSLNGGNGVLINGNSDNNLFENALVVAHPDGTNLLTVNEVTHSTILTGGVSALSSAALQVTTIDRAATAAKFTGVDNLQTGDIIKVTDNPTDNNTLFSVGANGKGTFKTTVNSTTAFQLQNSAGVSFFTVDNINANITLDGGNAGQVSTWQTNSSNPLPAGIGGINAVTRNGYVYAISGDESGFPGRPYYAKINANGSIGAWTQSASPGMSAVVNQMSVTVNGYLYVLGGNNGGDKKTVQYAHINSDGSLGAWNTTTTLTHTAALSMAFTANGYIYIVGGSLGGSTSGDYIYGKVNSDGTVSSWTRVTTNAMPAVKQSSAVAFSNGKVYIVGGDNGAGGGGTNTVYYASVDPTTGLLGTWTNATATTPLPAGLTGSSAAVVNGYLYVTGGNTTNLFPDTTHMVNSVYYARINSDGSLGAWSTSTNTLPVALETHAMITANGYLYALGGYVSGRTASTGVYYTSTGRILANASLDLVGSTNNNLADGGDQSNSSTGGSLTAGNTNIVGSLQVQNEANIGENLTVGGIATVGGLQVQNGSTSLFSVSNTTPGTNLFTNSSFESPITTPWLTKTGCTLSRVNTPVLFGSAAADCTNTATANAGLKSTLQLTASTAYTLSFYVKTSSAITNTFNFGYAHDGTTSTEDIANYSTTAQAVTTTGWTRFSLHFTTPATVSSSAYFYFKQTDATARDLYFDGMLIEQRTSTWPSTYIESQTTLDSTITSSLLIQPTENTSTALQVANSGGDSIFNVDSDSGKVGIGLTGTAANWPNVKLFVQQTAGVGLRVRNTDASSNIIEFVNGTGQVFRVANNGDTFIGIGGGDTTGSRLVLGNKSNAGDPAAQAGAMYYNASLGRFRCYEDGMWKNCVGFDSDNNRQYPSFSDDFIAGDFNQGALGVFPWMTAQFNTACSTAPTTTAQTGTASHPGVVQFDSGATSCTGSNGWRVNTNTDAAPAQILLSGGESFEAVFQVISSTNTTVRLGFHDATTATDADDGAYINISGLTLSGKIANNSISTGTRATTGTTFTITATTWYRAKVVVNTDLSGAVFTLYNDSGTVLWTSPLTSAIPSTAGRETGGGLIVQTTNTTLTHLLNMDYMAMWWTEPITR